MNPKPKKKKPPDPALPVTILHSMICFPLCSSWPDIFGLYLPCFALDCSALGRYSIIASSQWPTQSLSTRSPPLASPRVPPSLGRLPIVSSILDFGVCVDFLPQLEKVFRSEFRPWRLFSLGLSSPESSVVCGGLVRYGCRRSPIFAFEPIVRSSGSRSALIESLDQESQTRSVSFAAYCSFLPCQTQVCDCLTLYFYVDLVDFIRTLFSTALRHILFDSSDLWNGLLSFTLLWRCLCVSWLISGDVYDVGDSWCSGWHLGLYKPCSLCFLDLDCPSYGLVATHPRSCRHPGHVSFDLIFSFQSPDWRLSSHSYLDKHVNMLRLHPWMPDQPLLGGWTILWLYLHYGTALFVAETFVSIFVLPVSWPFSYFLLSLTLACKHAPDYVGLPTGWCWQLVLASSLRDEVKEKCPIVNEDTFSETKSSLTIFLWIASGWCSWEGVQMTSSIVPLRHELKYSPQAYVAAIYDTLAFLSVIELGLYSALICCIQYWFSWKTYVTIEVVLCTKGLVDQLNNPAFVTLFEVSRGVCRVVWCCLVQVLDPGGLTRLDVDMVSKTPQGGWFQLFMMQSISGSSELWGVPPHHFLQERRIDRPSEACRTAVGTQGTWQSSAWQTRWIAGRRPEYHKGFGVTASSVVPFASSLCYSVGLSCACTLLFSFYFLLEFLAMIIVDRLQCNHGNPVRCIFGCCIPSIILCNDSFFRDLEQHLGVLGTCLTTLEQHRRMLGLARQGLDCAFWHWQCIPFVAQHDCVLGPCHTTLEQHLPVLGLARRGAGSIYLPRIFVVVSRLGIAGPCIIALGKHRKMLETTHNGLGQHSGCVFLRYYFLFGSCYGFSSSETDYLAWRQGYVVPRASLPPYLNK